MKFKISTIQFLLLAACIIVPCLVHAQPPDFGGEDVNDVPIDGGLSLLVAAGVGYGVKKMRNAKKKKKAE